MTKKLTEEEAIAKVLRVVAAQAIRKRVFEGWSYKEIADRFGITQYHVRRLIQND
jgi:DNA-directed RNA polymerase specialized sigma24 family protein